MIARVVFPQRSSAVCKLLGLLSGFKVLLTSAALASSWLQVRTVEEQDAEYTFTMAPRPDLNWDGNVKQCPECAALLLPACTLFAAATCLALSNSLRTWQLGSWRHNNKTHAAWLASSFAC